jgi:hypothetical protein
MMENVFSSLGAPLPEIPGMASGGAVQAGRPYWVGENGRELFSPATNGIITPSSQTSNLYGGNNITIHIDGARDPQTVAEEVRKVLSDAVWQ